MTKPQDKETRYYIDIDLKTMKVVRWGYDQRENLVKYVPEKESYHRIYLTKGQYNKFLKNHSDFSLK